MLATGLIGEEGGVQGRVLGWLLKKLPPGLAGEGSRHNVPHDRGKWWSLSGSDERPP
jgi:hypothetical protein